MSKILYTYYEESIIELTIILLKLEIFKINTIKQKIKIEILKALLG